MVENKSGTLWLWDSTGSQHDLLCRAPLWDGAARDARKRGKQEPALMQGEHEITVLGAGQRFGIWRRSFGADRRAGRTDRR